MTEKKSMYIFLIILSAFLPLQAASNWQQLLVRAEQTKNSIKEVSCEFIKEHPYLTVTAGAAAAGGLIYGGWYGWDYYRDKRNPLEALSRGSRNRSVTTFNRAIGLLQNSDQIHTAMHTYRLSASERSQLLNKQAHKFSVNNAMQFLAQSGSQLTDDYARLTALNPTLLTPEGALEWCSSKISTSRDLPAYASLINLFLRPNLNLSDNVKRKIISYSFIEAWNANDFNRMEYLYSLGADLNVPINRIGTLFNSACEGNQIDKLNFLLKLSQSINISCRTYFNDSALHLATEKGHISIVDMLLTRCKIDPNVQNRIGDTSLHIACRKNNSEMISALLVSSDIDVNIQNSAGETPLHILCKSGDFNSFVRLLEKKITRFDLVDCHGCTPVLVAYKASCQSQRAKEIFGYLLQQPAVNYNAQDNEGNTVLHLALNASDVETAKALLSIGRVDPALVNKEGKSALHLAMEKNLVDIVRTCINDYKMNPHTPDHRGSSPLFFAVNNPEMLQYIVKHNSFTGSEQDAKGNTLCHIAIKRNYKDLFQALLDVKKIDVNAQNNKGKTPLHLLHERGYFNLILSFLQLPNLNVQVSLRDSHNRSILALLRARHENLYNAIQTYTPDNISLMPKMFSLMQARIAEMLIEKIKESHCSDAHKIKVITDRLSQPSQCPICIDNPESSATTLCCFGAKYCTECLKELMKQPHPKCPQCREVLFKEMVIRVPSEIQFVRKLFIPIACEGLSVKEPSQDIQAEQEILDQLMAPVQIKITEARVHALQQAIAEQSPSQGPRGSSNHAPSDAQRILSSFFTGVSSSSGVSQNGNTISQFLSDLRVSSQIFRR